MNQIQINDCWNKIGVWGNGEEKCPELEKLIHCNNCPVYSESGRKILDRKIEADYINEWADIISEPRQKTDTQQISVLVFRVGDEWFALPNKVVKEITHCSNHHSLPHRKNDVLRGLVNIRGELLLCVSLGYLFELKKAEKDEDRQQHIHERYIVIEDNNDNFVFPVSEVKNILRYNPDNLKPAPSTMQEISQQHIIGLIDYHNHHIGILDSERVFDSLRKNIS